MKGEIPFSSPCVIGHEITGEVVEHGPLTDPKIIKRFFLFSPETLMGSYVFIIILNLLTSFSDSQSVLV